MSVNSSALFNRIHDSISDLFKNTAEKNRMNLGDQANYLEDLFGNIFNVLYKYQVININEGKANVDAVDLVDDINKVMVQVTTRQGNFLQKKKDTVKGFLAEAEYKEFKKLYLLFLTDNPVPAKELTRELIRKGCNYEGIDKNKLLNKIKSARVPIKEQVLSLLLEEMEKRDAVQANNSLKIDQLKSALNTELQQFLSMKYFANTNKTEMPQLLGRRVKRYNQETKINLKDLEQTAEDQLKEQEVIVGELSILMLSEKPTFLFGEMGSGKSTIVAEFLLQQNLAEPSLNILIPANYIKGKITGETVSVLQLVASFITDQLLIKCDHQQINALIISDVVIIAFDGIDELAHREARNLVEHLKKISDNYSKLTILATGRPIELHNIVYRKDWNCLSTVDLSQQEMIQLLVNESLAEGQTQTQALLDADKRINYIKSRTDLLNLAVTPLILTMIRDYLTEKSDTFTVGDILYKVLNAKLEWEGRDPKKHPKNFFSAYPHVIQRQKFAASLASSIQSSNDKAISEETLYQVCSKLVSDHSAAGSQLTGEIVEYLKSTFLQKTDDHYSFISQPLLDTAYGVYLSDHLFDQPPTFEYCSIHWRAISIAAAVMRVKGETSDYLEPFKTLLQTFLIHEKRSTQSAVIVQEFRNTSLAVEYIELLKPLRFRPLKTWKDEDTNLQQTNSFAPIALANAIFLAGETGYQWFLSEYLDLRHPLNTHETGLSANLLLYYLIRNNYKLDDEKTDQLRTIARYTWNHQAFAITDILPVLSLLIPEEFSTRLRARLLLAMLQKDVAGERAMDLIEQLIKTEGPATVLEAVEVYAQHNEGNPKPVIVELWYHHAPAQIMNDAIFKATVSAIVHGTHELIEVLQRRISEENLVQYLKLLCLTGSPDADEAAILLYENFGISDFYLIARSIMLCSDWTHGKDSRRKNILDRILFEGENPGAKLAINMEFEVKEEIPLLAFEYMIKSYLFVDQQYPGYFQFAVQKLPKYSLPRNPELRDALSKLLKNKPVYFDTLRNSALALDMNLRRHAQQIMISCMPTDCAPELIAMLRGSLERLPSRDEWVAFINKLDFSTGVLDQVHAVLDQFNPWGKTHAMIILHRNQYRLTKAENEEFSKLLMGKGHFYDSGWHSKSQQRILEDPAFLPEMIKAMSSEELSEHSNAASMIYHHHKERVSPREYLYASIVQLQQHRFYLFQFAADFMHRLDETDFLAEMQTICAQIKKLLDKEQLVAEVFIQACHGDQSAWVQLLETIFFERGHFEEMMYYGLYTWLIFLRKTHPELAKIAGEAALQIARAPKQPNRFDNSIKSVFYLFANEFYQTDSSELEKALNREKPRSELTLALAVRSGADLPDSEPLPFHETIYSYFKANSSTYLQPKTNDEIASYFSTDFGIPSGFGSSIRSIVFFGTLTADDLERAKQGRAGELLLMIIRFLSDKEVNLHALVHMMGEAEHSALLSEFKGIIHILKEIKLQQPGGPETYISELKDKILKNNKVFLADLTTVFLELFEMKAKIEVELFQILIEEIVHRQYILKMNLLYQISEHIAEDVSIDAYEKLAEIVYTYIDSTLAYCDEIHQEDYYQIQWLFALIYLYIKKTTDTKVTYCFLMGMKSFFIQDSQIGYRVSTEKVVQFKARDLVHHTAILFERIPEDLVQQILIEGLTIDIPEIRVVCRLLRNFHLIKEK